MTHSPHWLPIASAFRRAFATLDLLSAISVSFSDVLADSLLRTPLPPSREPREAPTRLLNTENGCVFHEAKGTASPGLDHVPGAGRRVGAEVEELSGGQRELEG